MRYSLHEIDKHHVLATTIAVDRDEALEWFSEKLRLMLTFEGDPVAADYLLDEWHQEHAVLDRLHSRHRAIGESPNSWCDDPVRHRCWCCARRRH